jgi:flagellar biosynthesis protein FlhF
MKRAASAFARLRPDRVLLTKLDEAETLGPAFNVLCELGLPLGCVTTGQEVPDDIEHANPERFARWLLDLPNFARA